MTQQLALDGLTKSYPDGTTTRVVLDAVDLTVDAGELVAIMGPSGSGKSTLLHLVAGLDRPDSGQIKVGATFLSALSGAELAELRRTAVGYVEQRLNLIAVLSAVENVMLPLELGGMSARAARQQAMAALEAVGLADMADRDAERLSGGEQQRVAIARALAPGPRLLICDEAVSSLDVSVQAQILNLLRGLHADLGLALLFITHDLAVVRQMATRLYVMRHGRVVEHGDTDAVLHHPTDPYTRALFSAVPGRTPTAMEEAER